jgi:hypothetical protein
VTTRYLVQVRNHGESWRTLEQHSAQVVAELRGHILMQATRELDGRMVPAYFGVRVTSAGQSVWQGSRQQSVEAR